MNMQNDQVVKCCKKYKSNSNIEQLFQYIRDNSIGEALTQHLTSSNQTRYALNALIEDFISKEPKCDWKFKNNIKLGYTETSIKTDYQYDIVMEVCESLLNISLGFSSKLINSVLPKIVRILSLNDNDFNLTKEQVLQRNMDELDEQEQEYGLIECSHIYGVSCVLLEIFKVPAKEKICFKNNLISILEEEKPFTLIKNMFDHIHNTDKTQKQFKFKYLLKNKKTIIIECVTAFSQFLSECRSSKSNLLLGVIPHSPIIPEQKPQMKCVSVCFCKKWTLGSFTYEGGEEDGEEDGEENAYDSLEDNNNNCLYLGLSILFSLEFYLRSSINVQVLIQPTYHHQVLFCFVRDSIVDCILNNITNVNENIINLFSKKLNDNYNFQIINKKIKGLESIKSLNKLDINVPMWEDVEQKSDRYLITTQIEHLEKIVQACPLSVASNDKFTLSSNNFNELVNKDEWELLICKEILSSWGDSKPNCVESVLISNCGIKDPIITIRVGKEQKHDAFNEEYKNKQVLNKDGFVAFEAKPCDRACQLLSISHIFLNELMCLSNVELFKNENEL